jgi:hypothetical protein
MAFAVDFGCLTDRRATLSQQQRRPSSLCGTSFDFITTSEIIGGMAIFQIVISDLKRAERQLEKQLESVRTAIAAIAGGSPRRGQKRRGRRMSAAQRKAVSKRMKKYWAARRKAKK